MLTKSNTMRALLGGVFLALHVLDVNPSHAAAGNAVATLVGNTIQATYSFVGTEDMGGGIDNVAVQCALHNGVSGIATRIGTATPVAIPVGPQIQSSISCTLSASDLQILQSVPGSYAYALVERAGSAGKTVARSPTIPGTAPPFPGTVSYFSPKVQVTSVTKQGVGYAVAGTYTIQVGGTPPTGKTAQIGWYTTAGTNNTFFNLATFNIVPAGSALQGTFNVFINPTAVPGFAGSIGVFVGFDGAPRVFANVSFPTTLTCGTPTVGPLPALVNRPLNLAVSCVGNAGPLKVEWRDGTNALVATGANAMYTPAATGSLQLAATATDQLSPTISTQGISLTVNASAITVSNIPPPTVTTNAANPLANTGATLNGTVTSNGTATAVSFEYGLTNGYGSTAPATPISVVAGAVNAPVSAAINGLTCNTLYHFRVVGVNAGGTANGADVTFTTAACPTTVVTNAATAITTTGATLNGSVSSNGASTAVLFQYGPTVTYGTTVTATQSPLGAGANNVPVSLAISGLDCGATYHFRAVGGNTAGTINGADMTFIANPCPGTSTRLNIAPSAPLAFIATVTSNRSGTVRFTDGYYPDTQLINDQCPAIPTGLPGGTCNALNNCSQVPVDGLGLSTCVAVLACMQKQLGCHYITATYEGGSDAPSTSPVLAYPVFPPQAPQVTAVTAGNGDSSVTFATTNDGGLPLTSFTVIAVPVGGTGDTVSATITPAATVGVDRDAGSLSTTHVMSGLANGVSYTFQVIASNELGASPPSLPSPVVAPAAATLSAYSLNYVQKVYVAYYGRPADAAGLNYWAGQMDAAGQSLGAIIAAFGNSEEFNRRYGGLTSAQLVTRIYQQTLGRDPDPAGLAYYVGELQAGNRTLQTITLDVLNGASTAPDATVVSNRLEVASYYTAREAAGCAYGTEQTGVDALAIVTAGAASVTATKALIDARCGGN